MGTQGMIRLRIFLAAAATVAIGLIGAPRLAQDAAPAFLLGTLTLGGGFLICGLFAIRMPWHGIIGAGVLSLLGFGKGLLNLPAAAAYLVGRRPRGEAPLLELAVTLICLSLLLRTLHAWRKTRESRQSG